MVDTFTYEKPTVTHLNEMVIIVYTDDQTYQLGTTSKLNEMLSDNHGVSSVIEIENFDENNDGRPEELNVHIGLAGIRPEEVKSVIILQSINFGIEVSVLARNPSPCLLPAGNNRREDQASDLLDFPDPERLHQAARRGQPEHAPEVCARPWRHQATGKL